MIKEAIILAGGLGTRLKDEVPDLPKCMAPVAGHPFLTYVIRHLLSEGIEHFIFSLGYRHEVIEEYLQSQYPYLNYSVSIETQPLGTGGAILLAMSHTSTRNILVVNGDTLFKIDVDELSDKHMQSQAACTIALKPMTSFDRYGVVEIDSHYRALSFQEKSFRESGNINGGVYVLNKVEFLHHEFPSIFSFEKNYLESLVSSVVITGVIQETYFIDIGIPADFQKAQVELKYQKPDLNAIDETWTLFLDRDGVINHNIDDSYVMHRDQFQFLPGVQKAIHDLSDVFGKIIIVTNQRGIGKGLMDDQALGDIHQYMIDELEKAGGYIDALYYCPIVDDKHFERKPNPGMTLDAAHMYPEIDLSKSIMVGDKMSDMELGRNIGAFTVLIPSSQSVGVGDHVDVDLRYSSLSEFAGVVSSTRGDARG
ncbi:MAG: HAD-IIIA family hydrolase [Bacteroidota bacterium]|nr:HAD-IIIA family hydrolase [Bacteroidota bacterium]